MIIFSGVLTEPLFRFLFNEKWLSAAPCFQVLCLTEILYPLHSYNLSILKLKEIISGFTGIFLILDLFVY